VRLATSIAVALSALALGACGDDEDQPGTTTTTAAATPTEAEATIGEEPVAEKPNGDEGGGGSSEDESSQPQRPLGVEAVVEAVLTDGASPEQACGALVTDRFVRVAYGSRQGCLAARAPGATARTVEVTDVSESGERASAVAVPRGGPYDGVEVEVELVAYPALEGAWLVDSLLADVPPGP
jgi:hypothetical protein